jgi:outer membrane protein assembly factor BamB
MYRDTERAPLLIVANAGESNRYADLRALDTATGEERWAIRLSAGGVPRLRIEADSIFVLCGMELTCVDYQTGAARWQVPTPSGGERETQALGLLDGTLYVSSGSYVSAFDPSDGKLRWKAAGENLRYRSFGVPGDVVQGDFARERASRKRGGAS